jgi:hypothetical protein
MFFWNIVKWIGSEWKSDEEISVKTTAGRADSSYNLVWYEETKMKTNVNAKLDENFISIEFASLPGNSSPFCDIHLTYKEEHQPQLQLISLLS